MSKAQQDERAARLEAQAITEYLREANQRRATFGQPAERPTPASTVWPEGRRFTFAPATRAAKVPRSVELATRWSTGARTPYTQTATLRAERAGQPLAHGLTRASTAAMEALQGIELNAAVEVGRAPERARRRAMLDARARATKIHLVEQTAAERLWNAASDDGATFAPDWYAQKAEAHSKGAARAAARAARLTAEAQALPRLKEPPALPDELWLDRVTRAARREERQQERADAQGLDRALVILTEAAPLVEFYPGTGLSKPRRIPVWTNGKGVKFKQSLRPASADPWDIDLTAQGASASNGSAALAHALVPRIVSDYAPSHRRRHASTLAATQLGPALAAVIEATAPRPDRRRAPAAAPRLRL